MNWERIIKASFLSGGFMYGLAQLNHSTEPTQNSQGGKMESIVGTPVRLLEYPHFKILYSNYHKSPLAVHELITRQIHEGDAPRNRYFFPDDTIPEKHFQVDNSYYYDTDAWRRFNVNRGHMAAAGNYSGKESQKFHTFAFSNIVPQNGFNNGGIWNTFQRYTRKLVLSQQCDSVEVISGPIFAAKGKDEGTYSELVVLKENGIPIAEKLYKIIKCNTKRGPHLDAFMFDNKQTFDNSRQLRDFKVPLEEVERQTGLKFHIQGHSLDELEGLGLGAKKYDMDYQFFKGLMDKSTSLGEMSGNLRRAREQKIDVKMEQYTKRIRQLAKEQLRQIQNQQVLTCSRLSRYIALKRKLSFLSHQKQTSDLRDSLIIDQFVQCTQQKDSNEEQKASFKKFQERYGEELRELKGRVQVPTQTQKDP